MSFSYRCVERMDKLDLEFVEDGDAIHLRRKSTQELCGPEDEKQLIMELFEKHYVEVRAQFQHNGFWGTAMRNDEGQHDMNLPQGLGLYEWNKKRGEKPDTDTWPRMYTEAWLKGKV